MKPSMKAQMHQRLDAMSQARVTWEEGTLRASNDELYALLENLFTFYTELKADTAQRRALASLMTDLGIKVQANTSLALKVIRYVFGKQGRREETYARVIAIAYDMKTAEQSFVSYIQECGGLEEVRRAPTTKKSAGMGKEDYKSLALAGLQEMQVGVTTFDLPPFIQPNTDYTEDYAVALVRCNTDGTGTVLYGCNEASVIDAVLVSSGKDLDQRAQDSKAAEDAGDLASRRARDVKEFASKMLTMEAPVAVRNGAITRATEPSYG